MANYGNYNLKTKKKGKKLQITVTVIALLILAGIFYIGIVTGSNGDSMQKISTAVEENTQLKLQVSELNAQIEKMQSEIDSLKSEVDARPTISPTLSPDSTLAPTDARDRLTSPRSNRRNSED